VPRLHDAQIELPDALVRNLVDSLFPQWSGPGLRRVESDGTIHRVDRLGDDLVVRLPFIDWAVEDVARDAARLPILADALPVRVPALVGRGVPSEGMPWHWGVYSWLDGRHPSPGSDDDTLIPGLVAALKALRNMAPDGPPSPAAFDAALDDVVTRPKVQVLTPEAPWALDVWDAAIEAGAHTGRAAWVHGDLMPGNLLLDHEGRLASILDWGAAGIADPALDLLSGWTCLGPEGRATFLAQMEATPAQIALARGLALRKVAWGLTYYEATLPGFAAILRHVLAQIGDDAMSA